MLLRGPIRSVPFHPAQGNSARREGSGRKARRRHLAASATSHGENSSASNEQNMSKCSLELMTGPHAGEVFRLVENRTVIGRHPACDIVIDASSVSRQHAAVVLEGDAAFVEDLRSRNGTAVNGRPIAGRRQLEDGDEVQICDQRFLFSSRSPLSSDRVPLGTDVARSQDILESSSPDSVIVSQVEVAKPSPDDGIGVQSEAKLRAVMGLNRAIGASLSLEEVLPRLLDGLFEIFPGADRGFVLLTDPQSKRLVLRARKISGVPEPGPLRLSLSLMDKVVQTRRAILSADAASDSRFKASASVADCRIRSVMCVPFIQGDGGVLGVLQVDSRDPQHAFQREDLVILAGIAGQATQAIEQALAHDERIGQEQLKRDLELAHRVQQGLLPSKPPEIPGYQVFDFYEPARQIGGDFFGYVPLPDGRMAVVLADVSGKGISAALVMAALSADVRYCLASEGDAAVAVSRINESFCRSGWDDRFATLVVAVLDPAAHRLAIVNAGHMPVFVRDAAGRVQAVGSDSSGVPIGVDPEHVYHSFEIDISAGTMFLLYTDGISEAMDHEHHTYGLDRLMRVLGERGDTVEEVGRRILGDVERHATGQVRSDDMCLVCLSRDSGSPSSAESAQMPRAVRGQRPAQSST
jgi:sigma-B regulation protein RsbU (phosphoserine phosphatase)